MNMRCWDGYANRDLTRSYHISPVPYFRLSHFHIQCYSNWAALIG